ncbi:MAG: PTS transporter subunit EIIB [Steroidobacteraceae bacterium]
MALAAQRDAQHRRVDVLAGAGNILAIDACMTRLRVTIADAAAVDDPARLLAALGGIANLRGVESASGRLLFTIANDDSVDERALAAAAPRGFARPAPGSLHALLGAGADDLYGKISARLGHDRLD